jgi:hypothetical protein
MSISVHKWVWCHAGHPAQAGWRAANRAPCRPRHPCAAAAVQIRRVGAGLQEPVPHVSGVRWHCTPGQDGYGYSTVVHNAEGESSRTMANSLVKPCCIARFFTHGIIRKLKYTTSGLDAELIWGT